MTSVFRAVGIGLLVSALAVYSAAAAPPLQTVPAVAARARAAVVSISTRPLTAADFAEGALRPGLGSGVIVDPAGVVLTNHHVVHGAVGPIKVALSDDRTFQAQVVGTDPVSDIAVLRVPGGRLPSLRLGDSSRLRIGEPVVAIGSAMWIEGGPSVTAGIVSALNRSLEQPGLPLLHHLIQTDAAINPGNSGGPLLNLRGEVIGINTALIPSAHGIGFAIAINEVKPVMRQLLASGRVVRPWLGFDGVSVTAPIAYANDLSVDRGVYVVRVPTGGPANQAGLQPGDVLIRLGPNPVRTLHEFEDLLGRRRPGERIPVTVRRGPDIVEAVVTVVERQATAE